MAILIMSRKLYNLLKQKVFNGIFLCQPHGPSEIKNKFHGVKIMECWPLAPLPARRAYRPEGISYGSERTME